MGVRFKNPLEMRMVVVMRLGIGRGDEDEWGMGWGMKDWGRRGQGSWWG